MSTLWPSTPPDDCPYPPSSDFRGLAFTGRHREYTGADTWYPSWAEDDTMVTPWTDGNFSHPVSEGFAVQEMECSSDSRNAANKDRGGRSATGQARVYGDDPLNLRLENLGLQFASPAPYEGRYPCGSLIHDGVWYYGTYCLDESYTGLNWDILGPFVGFRISRDMGQTWQECPHTPDNPIFGESGKNGSKVKIGAPHFVDFGKNLQHSPDGKAYLVGHGATRPDSLLAWIQGDQVYMIRVTPSSDAMNDPSQYEFFAGHDANGSAIWARDFNAIRPLVEWNGRTGHATMTYNAPLKKFLLCVTDGRNTVSPMNTYILESDHITGPWKLVSFMENFGTQAYFVNIPSRFISGDGKTLWLSYSANFTNLPGGEYGTKWEPNPPGSQYAWCLQEVQLVT